MKLKDFNKIHFVGIGGISMSALATLLASKKYNVTGNDDNDSDIVQDLRSKGIKVSIGNDLDDIKVADLVVYTNAISQNSPTISLAKKLNKPMLERAQLLGMISSEYREVIAISGTHGKTTTTAMLGIIFKTANLFPTIHMGGISNDWNSNLQIGHKKYFVTEACEYNKSFLHLRPSVSIITNIEPDHMDCYHNIEELQSAFLQFARQTKDCLVINGDTVPSDIPKSKSQQNLITFGLSPTNHYYAKNLKASNGKYSFDCYYKNENLGNIQLNIVGKHNVYNALGAIATSLYFGIQFDDIKKALSIFSGVNRRFEKIYDADNLLMIHDYAHHPTEIKCSIRTAKQIAQGRLIVIFEPHTYSRTCALIDYFATAFNGADKVIILPTYPARESYILGGDAIDLFYRVAEHTPETQYFQHLHALFNELDKDTKSGDTLLWLGAGTIYDFAKKYVEHKTMQKDKKSPKTS